MKDLSAAQMIMLDTEVPLIESGGKLDFHYADGPATRPSIPSK
ncbi:hypothetical protein [Rubellimicrobium roseum]|nr:hypothetical protein [Rubellimicrobium roseum]